VQFLCIGRPRLEGADIARCARDSAALRPLGFGGVVGVESLGELEVPGNTLTAIAQMPAAARSLDQRQARDQPWTALVHEHSPRGEQLQGIEVEHLQMPAHRSCIASDQSPTVIHPPEAVFDFPALPITRPRFDRTPRFGWRRMRRPKVEMVGLIPHRRSL
jgi:hypothetical protein